MLTDDYLSALLIDALPEHQYIVRVSTADVRRLKRYVAAVAPDFADEPDPPDPENPDSIAEAIVCTMWHGLDRSEADDGLWADPSGRTWDLPRRVRAPWRSRLKFARRAAVQTWRST